MKPTDKRDLRLIVVVIPCYILIISALFFMIKSFEPYSFLSKVFIVPGFVIFTVFGLWIGLDWAHRPIREEIKRIIGRKNE